MGIQDFTMDFFSLKGKNAIVTGGNTGLGQSFALALAKAGANLFVPSILDDDGTTKDLIEAEGVGYEFMKIDITDDGAPKKIIETCDAKLGSIDILVNSAGISILAEVENFGREQWDKVVSINLTAAFELSFEASKFMIPQKSGKIINIVHFSHSLGAKCLRLMHLQNMVSQVSQRLTAMNSPNTTFRSMGSPPDIMQRLLHRQREAIRKPTKGLLIIFLPAAGARQWI